MDDRFKIALHYFERVIVVSLIVMLMVVVLQSTAELGWIVIKSFFTPPLFLPSIEDLLDIFGFFLLILIGVELLHTIKAYLSDHVIHVEIVLEVALIAVARKAIILDIEDLSSLTIVGISTLIVAIAGAYFLLRRYRKSLYHQDK